MVSGGSIGSWLVSFDGAGLIWYGWSCRWVQLDSGGLNWYGPHYWWGQLDGGSWICCGLCEWVSSVDGGGVDGVDGVYWVKVKVRLGGSYGGGALMR
ncbi:unnamed protein product [Prunus armeniaca]|uniref:Uncharacterized protein n=1 Tax=Prunus armeniaca TaxID=36596 RepID=A0A6J5XSN8_PRUAR|nr:unnamed protein product [Prunus armeniaca]